MSTYSQGLLRQCFWLAQALLKMTPVISILFFTGLLGSLGHCLGMCGPLVLMVGAQFSGIAWTSVLPRYFLYHSARIVVYSLLGLLAGAFGLLIGMGSGLTHIAGIISLIFGTGIILLGLRYLGWLPLGSPEGSGNLISRMMNKALRRGGLWGLASLGALNGLLPCGLVYSALLAAAATGAPFKAAVAMAAFGAGTLPALLVLGMGAGMLSVRARQIMSRVAGLLIMLVGVQLILRGAAGIGWVSHWKLGGIMIF